MNDQPRDDDLELGRQLKAQEALYNAAVDSPVSERGLEWMFRARLLLRITDHDVHAAGGAIHTPGGHHAARKEFDALPEPERIQLGAEIGEQWAICLKVAVQRLWHACQELEIDPSTLNEDHVALTAATLLSGKPGPFAQSAPLDEAA